MTGVCWEVGCDETAVGTFTVSLPDPGNECEMRLCETHAPYESIVSEKADQKDE